MKRIFKTAVLLISLIFIAPQVGFGGEPPAGAQIGGPSIVGLLTLQNERDGAGNELGYMTVTFRGFCKVEYVKIKICFFPLPVTTFAEITKDNLLYYVLASLGPSDCNTECGGEDIIVTKVITFKRIGSKHSPYQDTIVAEVVFRFLI